MTAQLETQRQEHGTQLAQLMAQHQQERETLATSMRRQVETAKAQAAASVQKEHKVRNV